MHARVGNTENKYTRNVSYHSTAPCIVAWLLALLHRCAFFAGGSVRSDGRPTADIDGGGADMTDIEGMTGIDAMDDMTFDVDVVIDVDIMIGTEDCLEDVLSGTSGFGHTLSDFWTVLCKWYC